ncbi:hypothetical protein M3Y99_00279100 [Aphelenchoides fujianensis]|nr:hypothetical protein M3Y99_00279100 [Aphelenchoides fujianensis]
MSDADYFRERTAGRRRILRPFFCCRFFAAVFCSRSEKKEKTAAIGVGLYGYGCSLSRGVVSGPFWCHLNDERASFDSLKRILRLGRSSVGQLHVDASMLENATFEYVRSWAEFLSTVKEMPRLESVDVALQIEGKHPWVVHLLQDFLPLELVRLIQGDLYGFLVLERKSPMAVAEKASVYVTYDETPDYGPFFRTPARVLRITESVREAAQSGPG